MISHMITLNCTYIKSGSRDYLERFGTKRLTNQTSINHQLDTLGQEQL